MTGKAKVIAFANQKGGVAKTTTTLNLAAAFAEEGHRVLCIDMDPQGNLTMSQGIDPDTLEVSMFDVLVRAISSTETNVSGQLGYPFRAVLDFDRFSVTWCKTNPVPGEREVPDPGTVIELPRACRAT